jgi:hypothetical protein
MLVALGCGCWLHVAVDVGCTWLWMLVARGCGCWLHVAVDVGCTWLQMLVSHVGCKWLWMLIARGCGGPICGTFGLIVPPSVIMMDNTVRYGLAFAKA